MKRTYMNIGCVFYVVSIVYLFESTNIKPHHILPAARPKSQHKASRGDGSVKEEPGESWANEFLSTLDDPKMNFVSSVCTVISRKEF